MSTVTIKTESPASFLGRLGERFLVLRSKVRRRLSTRPNAIQTTAGAERLDVRSPNPHWIVGRGLCMYRREDFSNVPRNRRRTAMELRLPVWSPFRNTGHHCVWSGGIAMVWFWDADKVAVGEELFDGPAGADAGVRIVPESVFHPAKSNGTHLQACREGFELQRWRDNVLEDAFWFPGAPDPRDIAWFATRAEDGEGPEFEAIPRTPATPLLPDPWSSALAPREWLEANELPLVATAFLVLAVALIWQEARFWKTAYVKEATATAFEQMQEALAPELTARNELLELRRQNRAMATILDEPSQARLMAIVDGILPNDTATFQAWRYQGRELRVLVEDQDPDPVAYVEAFSTVPIFTDVRAAPERTPTRLEITLRVVP